MIRLGVNIDHVATLREVRKEKYPDIIEALFACERGGAEQITVHLREDRRHIQEADIENLLKHSSLPINLECAFVPEIVNKACEWRPWSATLVPERRQEMTTESGLNLEVVQKNLPLLQQLKEYMRVYGFIDTDPQQVELARTLGLEGVEFHTGPFARAYQASLKGRGDLACVKELQKLQLASERAGKMGLEVKAGHGLTIHNVRLILKLPYLSEVNIGYAIIARAVILGLEAAVREMKMALTRTP